MIDINLEKIRNEIIGLSNYEPDPEYQKRLEEYHKKIEDDFQTEWPKKKCKWFFKKRRQQKLRRQISHRYSGPVFWIIEDMIDDVFSNQWQSSEFFGQFVDVKDIAVGDKNCLADEFIEKRRQDIFSSCGCPSYMLTSNRIEQLVKEEQQ